MKTTTRYVNSKSSVTKPALMRRKNKRIKKPEAFKIRKYFRPHDLAFALLIAVFIAFMVYSFNLKQQQIESSVDLGTVEAVGGSDDYRVIQDITTDKNMFEAHSRFNLVPGDRVVFNTYFSGKKELCIRNKNKCFLAYDNEVTAIRP